MLDIHLRPVTPRDSFLYAHFQSKVFAQIVPTRRGKWPQTSQPGNSGSGSSIEFEQEFTRETSKILTTETSFGIGFDYYVHTNLERRYGVVQGEKLSQRALVRIQAAPGEFKVYEIVWKEVWVAGDAEFELGTQKKVVPFRPKSALEFEIRQEVIA